MLELTIWKKSNLTVFLACLFGQFSWNSVFLDLQLGCMLTESCSAICKKLLVLIYVLTWLYISFQIIFLYPPLDDAQDPFKYTYPPLPDDDFQTPLCENGPIVSEDDVESKEGEMESRETLESSFNSEIVAKPKKVNC